MSIDPFINAADTANMQAGGTSFLSSVGDFFTKGVSSAAISGIYGILNTGIDASNAVFGTQTAHADTSETLHNLDQNWGNYYDEHKAVIDAAGFAATALVPGMLAVKGLKLVQAGNSVGTFSRVLGYTTRMENFYLNKALGELATEGGTIFTRINASKAASIAWGVADNVLQTAAFETAVAATMKSSPILENEDWKNILHDVGTTSLLGGVIGGGIGGLLTNKLWKDAGKAVDIKMRGLDVLKSSGKVDLAVGDRSMEAVDAVLQLPKEIADPSVILSHGREGIVNSLDVSKLLDRTLKDTIVRGVQRFESEITNNVAGDATVGQPLTRALVEILQEGITKKQSPDSIRSALGDYLYNLKSVEGIGNRPLNLTGEIRFLDPKADITKSNAMSSIRGESDKFAYRVIGDESQAKILTIGKDAATADDAFKLGADIAFDPGMKTVKISPATSIWQKVPIGELDYTPMFFNTKTKQTSFDTVATVADVQTTKTPLQVSVRGVVSGDRSFTFGTAYKEPVDSVEATARHLWADSLPKISGTVDTRDVALMDALAKDPAKAADGLIIWDEALQNRRLFAEIPAFESEAYKAKFNSMIDLLNTQGEATDLRDIAYRSNASLAWVQEAVARKLNSKDMFGIQGWKNDASTFAERENLLFRYDTAAQDAAQLQPSAEVAWNYRVKEAVRRSEDASNAVLGDHAKLLPALASDLAKTADSQGVGATFWGASNANYSDKLRAAFQYIGTQTAQITNERVSAALASLQSPAARLIQNPIAAAEVAAATTASRLSTDAWSLYTDALTGKRLMVDLESYEKVLAGGKLQFARQIELSQEAGDFLAAHHTAQMARVEQQKVLAAAQGVPIRWNPNKLYLPPVDTQRVPFFAFVRQEEGTIFGSSEVAMITARDAAELQRRATAILASDPSLKVIYKGESEAFHKARGDYEFSRTMNEPVLDSTLRKKGLLGDYLPNMSPEGVINDYIQYAQRSETRLVRDAVSTRYSQQFAQLEDLSERYIAPQMSSMTGLSKWTRSAAQDPFGDYTKLALNISKRGEFTLMHQANEFVDSLGTKAFRTIENSLLRARGGEITWQEANDQLAKFGLGPTFTSQEVFQVAQTAPDRNLMQVAIQKANMLIANGMLRLDWANSILNTISTPILLGTEVAALRNSIKNDPELFTPFNSLLKSTVPNTDIQIPSATKLIFNAVADYPGDVNNLMQRFKAIGTVKGPAALFHDMIDDISLRTGLVPSEWSKTVDSWVEKGSKWTGNNLAEDFTRYVTSHAMWQITEPIVKRGAMTVQEQNAFISIFTNRVQGNYIASQRPIAFQGTIGSAVGLFQTYQFNLFQQLFRHIENKDAKTIAVMGALQGTLFGLNGLPMFDAINTHIIGTASINEKHSDAYSYAVQAVGKQFGDWLLYGSASAFPLFSEQAPALWTRGDLNPRNAFILPTSPMEVPAVQASLKVIQGITGMASQIANGASLKDAMLFGLEHNGLNRPLTGLAQVLKGNATTSKGDLISANNDWLSIATASRLIGAKPLDESIALTAMFRSKAYQAADKEKIDALGTVVKDKMRANQPISSEDWIDFQGSYAAAGGRIEGFNKAMQRWDKGANTSIVNEVMRHSQTAAGQRMITVLGGDPLQDYSSQISAANGSEDSQQALP